MVNQLMECEAVATIIVNIASVEEWHVPKFFVRPKEGPTMSNCGSRWNLVPPPTSSTKGGERGVLKTPRLD
jgi:hypothetical protein